jgi:hypothetical protein
MFNSVSHLHGAPVFASDGEIGTVEQIFFDDRHWTVRYLVVDTGRWLASRRVLVSPYAVRPPLDADDGLQLALTCEQVHQSPTIDTQQPVSRRHERALLLHYRHPDYWEGSALWGLGSVPYPLSPPMTEIDRAANRGMLQRDYQAGDVHLHRSSEVTGYAVNASDGGIGHVKDFAFDDDSWAIRYLVLDTSSWWRGGRPVLVGTRWTNDIDWAGRRLGLRLTREQVKASPPFQDVGSIGCDFEQRLHGHFGRPGYWV